MLFGCTFRSFRGLTWELTYAMIVSLWVVAVLRFVPWQARVHCLPVVSMLVNALVGKVAWIVACDNGTSVGHWFLGV